jgi:DNA-binding response OmpR family regulator
MLGVPVKGGLECWRRGAAKSSGAKAGLEVRTAGDGQAALAAVQANTPDLILLDISMPNGDGFEVCRKIRENPVWQDIRIIMLTAKGKDSERERGLAAGADDYITKPFSTHDVIDRVAAQIGPAGTD